MKKKKLLEIPPIPLRGAQKKYYRMAAEIYDIEGERHLVMDVYESRRDVGEKDYDYVFRAAYTPHDWGLYNPRTGSWSRGSIKDSFGKPVYDKCGMISGPGIPTKAGWNNTALDEETEMAFKAFWKAYGDGYTVTSWEDILVNMERQIAIERNRKEQRNRREKLKRRLEDMPAVPADFEDWADAVIFQRKEYVYYKRHGRWADCTCSKCGETYSFLTRRKETFEGQFEKIYSVPKTNERTTCHRCGADVVYKTLGRAGKHIHGERNWAYLIQPFRTDGAVIRYFDMCKEWSTTKPSRVNGREIGRVFFEAGRIRTDWYLHDYGDGCNKWCDHNIGGFGNLTMSAGKVYTNNAYDWKKSRVLRYSGLREYIWKVDMMIRPARYLEAAERWPLEKLSKMGLTDLVTELIENRNAKNDRWLEEEHSNKAERILGIRPCRLSLLRDRKGDVALLFVLQAEKKVTAEVLKGNRKGKGEWTDKQIAKLYNLAVDKDSLIKALQYMTVTQFLNRVEKYIGSPVPENIGDWGCGRQANSSREIAQIYLDYIRMRIDGGYGMQRSSDQAPRDLWEAHRNMVRAANAVENEKRAAECNEKYPEIRRRYRALKRRFAWQYEGLCIRPAKDAGEIIEEGRILHHCVGSGDFYISRHNSGESYILFLRDIKNPNRPYITVEIGDNDHIRQWYGRNDTKPGARENELWLKEWLKSVEERKIKLNEAASYAAQPASAEAVQVIAAAV